MDEAQQIAYLILLHEMYCCSRQIIQLAFKHAKTGWEISI